MSHIINDKTLIEEATTHLKAFVEETTKQVKAFVEEKYASQSFKVNDLKFTHPLDDEILDEKGFLIKLKPHSNEESIDYRYAKELDELWEKLIRKSIECLRFFDEREPFIKEGEKKALAYGLDSLIRYHDRYTKFESMLYGASSFYRDHVFHVIRTWLLGVFCLTKKMNDDSTILIDSIVIDGEKDSGFSGEINAFEKLSMWTIIALCHDLGYPLEKAEQILDKTQEMMKDFIPKPNIWNNFGFSGTQDTINEYILRFISTKMKPSEEITTGENKKTSKRSEQIFLGRIQPKYYLKFAKSLEGFNHGIISAVIIYKMLLYFLESDFNLNDDHHYTHDDARQFYIRREILRAMAAHTCPDIYSINLATFSSLLFLSDELQQWGRKSWKDMYAGLDNNAVQLTINSFTPSNLDVKEEIKMDNLESTDTIAENIAHIFKRQYSLYKTTFRDGQYTTNRDLNIKKEMKIKLKTKGTDENEINIKYELSKSKSSFEIDFSKVAESKEKNERKELRDSIVEKIKDSLYSSDFNVIDQKT